MKHKTLVAACATFLACFAMPGRAETVRVFAAASLAEAFQDIGSLYRTQNPNDEVEFQFAGSQVLRTQIEEGAPADVFASADRVHMDALKGKGWVGSDAVFARNRLVVVTPAAKPVVQHLGDLARPGVRIVVADANVPVGRYTNQILAKMNKSGLYGDDFQKRFLANVVSQETNVRAVLAKVSLDEVDAGVVYTTDARTVAEKVRALEIPKNMNLVAEYPIAVVTGRGGEKSVAAKEAAARFVALVRSESGQAFLVKRGFEPAP
jgi:molybdate transport system substrate-binding protein